MMPPRIAPAAPPMTAPFTLFLLVTAPITAPAPAPIAASRFVCFTVTSRGCDATVPELEPTLDPELDPLDTRRRVVVCDTSPLDERVVVRGVVADGAAASAFARSAGDRLSSDAGCACAASDRSVFSALSAGLLSFLLHAPMLT